MVTIEGEGKVKAFEYRVVVRGVWGRNRSVKTQGFALDTSVKPLDAEAVAKLADAKLAEIKVKPGSLFSVTEQPVTIERNILNGVAYTSTSFMIFSHKVLLKGAV